MELDLTDQALNRFSESTVTKKFMSSFSLIIMSTISLVLVTRTLPFLFSPCKDTLELSYYRRFDYAKSCIFLSFKIVLLRVSTWRALISTLLSTLASQIFKAWHPVKSRPWFLSKAALVNLGVWLIDVSFIYWIFSNL